MSRMIALFIAALAITACTSSTPKNTDQSGMNTAENRVPAQAQSTVETAKMANILLRTILDETTYANFPGTTPDGKNCGLFITDKTQGSDVTRFYVVVGPNNAVRRRNEKDAYIGVDTPRANVTLANGQLSYSAAESWGNNSRQNQVSVYFKNGAPDIALGVSDVRKLECRLKPGKTFKLDM